jgi:MFS family permease
MLMGLATLGVGLLPVYEQVGLLAPLLLLTLRLLQGFAMGGEVGGVAVYLTEHAPKGKRGLYTSVLQLMGPLGIFVSSMQVLWLQHELSDAQFHAWGWRIPFLFSALLMLVMLKTRMSLHESPVFRQLEQQGRVTPTPLRDCLRDRRILGRMGLLFFCISAGGSLLFFSSQIYALVFLKSVVRLDATLAGELVMVSTVALIPLTIYCGWLSDRIGRRPVLLAGLLLGAISILPVFHGLLHYGNPALERFNREVAIQLSGEHCAYSPFTQARNDCERIQEFLTARGVTYTVQPAHAGETLVRVNDQQIAGFQQPLLETALQQHGWTPEADSQQANRAALILLLLIPAIAVALITGPQTAVLPELFPAKVRYTAAALPHNLSAGWIGGLSPFMVTLISVHAGDALSGLWYPVGLLILAAVIGLLFLPETKGVALDA